MKGFPGLSWIAELPNPELKRLSKFNMLRIFIWNFPQIKTMFKPIDGIAKPWKLVPSKQRNVK